jgi:hypothetical protein
MIRWRDYPEPDATTARGWLFVLCGSPDDHVLYNSETLPVWDDDLNDWREQASLGNYLDYGPDHYRSAEARAEQPGNVHALAYNPTRTHYFETVQDAKAWIEQQARESRPDVAMEVAP